MADPHIKSPMDFWDYTTVCLYRTAFILAAIFTALLPYYPHVAQIGILTAAAFSASSLHIYLKNIRLLLQFSNWIALLCAILGFPEVALGGALVTLGGLAFKEYFCFRIFTLNFQPMFMAFIWFSFILQINLLLQIFTAISGLLFLILAIQKWRMPLHFDIGDKGKYQI